MRDFKFDKNALFFSILTLITVLTWTGVEIYLTATKTTIPKVTQEQMAPLDSKIKEEVIESLKVNFWLSEEELSNFNFSSSIERAQER